MYPNLVPSKRRISQCVAFALHSDRHAWCHTFGQLPTISNKHAMQTHLVYTERSQVHRCVLNSSFESRSPIQCQALWMWKMENSSLINPYRLARRAECAWMGRVCTWLCRWMWHPINWHCCPLAGDVQSTFGIGSAESLVQSSCSDSPTAAQTSNRFHSRRERFACLCEW